MNISEVEKEIYAQYDRLAQKRNALVIARHEYDDCLKAESDRARKNILRLKLNRVDDEIGMLNKVCQNELNLAGKKVAELMQERMLSRTKKH